MCVFDTAAAPSEADDDEPQPLLRLTGHDQEGYGLAWCPLEEGRLLRCVWGSARCRQATPRTVLTPHPLHHSGADDRKICMWDTESGPRAEDGSVPPLRTFLGHSNVVEDVAWHCHHKDLFGSVGDDRQLMMYVFV